MQAHAQPGSVALRAARSRPAVQAREDDRDAHLHGRLLALQLEVRGSRRAAGRERVARRLLADRRRGASTRLAVRAALEAWVTVQAASISCQTHSAASSSQNSMPMSSRRRLAALVAQSRAATSHDGSGRERLGRRQLLGLDRRVGASEAIVEGDRAAPGSTTGPRAGRARVTLVLCRQRSTSAPLRHAFGRSSSATAPVRACCPSRVGRVGRQLARALARGVAGEHERVADEPDLPQAEHDHDQQRQQAHRTRRSTGRARRPGGRAGRARSPPRRLGLVGAGQRLELGGERLERARAASGPPGAPASRC